MKDIVPKHAIKPAFDKKSARPNLSRALLAFEKRDALSGRLCSLLEDFGAKAVCGLANRDIAWAASCAMRLCVPMVYVRRCEKSHGLKRKIEGEVDPCLEYVIVAGEIENAQDILLQAQAIESARARAVGCAAVFCEKEAEEKLSSEGIKVKSLI